MTLESNIGAELPADLDQAAELPADLDQAAELPAIAGRLGRKFDDAKRAEKRSQYCLRTG